MKATTTRDDVPRWQDCLGRVLMGLTAAAALAAFAAAIAAAGRATPEARWAETWMLFGFLVFAGMFALLAWRPRKSAGLWELAFVHKAAMGLSALFLSKAEGAARAGAVDGALAAVILAAYVLTRGWRAWNN